MGDISTETRKVLVSAPQSAVIVQSETSEVSLAHDGPTIVAITERTLVSSVDESSDSDDYSISVAPSQVLLSEAPSEAVISSVQQDVELRVQTSPVALTTGVRGPQGPLGPQEVFVQETAPVGFLEDYIWIQTGLGAGDDFTIWFDDGA